MLETLVNGIGDHVRFPNKLIRHVSQPMVHESEANRVSCTSKVAVYHVDPKGVGGLYAVANYQDRFWLTAGAGPLLLSRNVALDTRTLPFGSHIPLQPERKVSVAAWRACALPEAEEAERRSRPRAAPYLGPTWEETTWPTIQPRPDS